MGYLKISDKKGDVLFDSRGLDFSDYSKKEYKQGHEPHYDTLLGGLFESIPLDYFCEADFDECGDWSLLEGKKCLSILITYHSPSFYLL
jgi:hypothetical protein